MCEKNKPHMVASPMGMWEDMWHIAPLGHTGSQEFRWGVLSHDNSCLLENGEKSEKCEAKKVQKIAGTLQFHWNTRKTCELCQEMHCGMVHTP